MPRNPRQKLYYVSSAVRKFARSETPLSKRNRLVSEMVKAQTALAQNLCPNGCGPLAECECVACKFRYSIAPPAKIEPRVDFHRTTVNAALY